MKRAKKVAKKELPVPAWRHPTLRMQIVLVLFFLFLALFIITSLELKKVRAAEKVLRGVGQEFCAQHGKLEYIYVTQGGEVKCANESLTTFYNKENGSETHRIVQHMEVQYANGTIEVVY